MSDTLVWTMTEIRGWMVIRIYPKGKTFNYSGRFDYLHYYSDENGIVCDSYTGTEFAVGRKATPFVFPTYDEAETKAKTLQPRWKEYKFLVIPAIYAVVKVSENGQLREVQAELVLAGQDFKGVGGRIPGLDADYELAMNTPVQEHYDLS